MLLYRIMTSFLELEKEVFNAPCLVHLRTQRLMGLKFVHSTAFFGETREKINPKNAIMQVIYQDKYQALF